jgi:recombination protein RecR
MALHLLERDRDGARHLAQALVAAVEQVGYCGRCRNLSEQPVCALCGNNARDSAQLCVVESPADVLAIEQSGVHRGLYFVLMGRLSPLDGIGPEELGLDLLERRLEEGEVKEVILATNPTVEGETTAHYIAELARRHGVRPTRIAHGVPLGGELEYVDGTTLSRALSERREM